MSDFNDVAQEAIQKKLTEAISNEGITKAEAAKCIGVHATYISMIAKKIYWKKCPKSGWEAVRRWSNSGVTLKAYKDANVIEIRQSAEETVEKAKSESQNVGIGEIRTIITGMFESYMKNQGVIPKGNIDINIQININKK